MSAFTLFFLITSGLLAALGFTRGIIRRLGALAALICGIIVCRVLGPALVERVMPMAPEHPWMVNAATYALIFAVVYIVVTFVASRLHQAVDAVKLGILNRLAGAGFYLALWWIVLSLGLNIYLAMFPDAACDFAGGWRGTLVQLAPRIVGYFYDNLLNIPNCQGV